MKKPVLLVLAAGMGSRYGGLKQLEPVGENDQLIIDYSIYDAKRAGFEEVIFVIRREMEEAFDQTIRKRIGDKMKISYAYQELSDLPEGFAVPADRSKPWGTAHAALSARKLISGPFAIINADDFYGAEAYEKVFQFLEKNQNDPTLYGLVGYYLKNTVTEHGTVSRGVCTVDSSSFLQNVEECTHIEKGEATPRFTRDQGKTWENLDGDTIVSMNLWGFQQSYLTETARIFKEFLQSMDKPLTNEFYLPTVADQLIHEAKAKVSVLSSGDQWYGVTYPDDRPTVVEAIAGMTKDEKYPKNLWS